MTFYLIRFANNVYKFGVTSKSLRTRYAGERTGYIVVATWTVPNMDDGRHIEAKLKYWFQMSAYRGPQLLSRTGTSEMLHLSDTKAAKVRTMIDDLVCDAILR